MEAIEQGNRENIDITHSVPILIGEVYSGGTPLDTSAIDQNMYLAIHRNEGPVEERAYRRQIAQVAFKRGMLGERGLAWKST